MTPISNFSGVPVRSILLCFALPISVYFFDRCLVGESRSLSRGGWTDGGRDMRSDLLAVCLNELGTTE